MEDEFGYSRIRDFAGKETMSGSDEPLERVYRVLLCYAAEFALF